jgi:tetratricopeptide (TPR) repeat protein/predicted Ser/Thr protein kinase
MGDSEHATRTLSGDAPAASSPEGPELARGTTLHRYVILKRLGRGGMGVVYLAFDGELDRRVAIKVLRPELEGRRSARDTRARLLREAQAMAKVSHPNVVSIYDVGTFGDEVFLAMEYVSGETLRAWRARLHPNARAIVEAYVQAGRGLEAAHAVGILHRDFKPENTLVDERGRVRVLDFGLARLEGSREPEEITASDPRIAFYETGIDRHAALSTPLTHQGAILGTPAYMAPEQLVGEGATARSDQFAFAAALYEALFGVLPFDGTTTSTLASAIHAARYRPVPRGAARVPSGVRRVLARALSGAPDRRFGSMSELLHALERAVRARQRWLIGAGSAAAIAAVTALAVTRAPATRVCRGAEEAFAPAWSDARAAEVQRAFRASGNARADEAFEHTRALLDGYAAKWASMHRDACEATRVRREQSEEGLDLRMSCLREREEEAKATVDLLARADSAAVDKAVDAVDALAPVESCVDLNALRAPFAPPATPAARTKVEELRERLATAHALQAMGRYDEALAPAHAVAEEAKALDYGPVLAEALFAEGDVLRSSRPLEAHAVLFDAALAAEASRHDVVAAEAWIDLVLVVGEQENKYDRAADLARIADASLARARDSGALRGRLLRYQATVAYHRGSQAEARSLAERAVDVSTRALGSNDVDTLAAEQTLADTLLDEGELERARDMYARLRAAHAALLGPSHPRTARSLSDVGEIALELGDYAAAIESLRASLPNVVPLSRAEVLYFLGEALIGRGTIDEGMKVVDQAVEQSRQIEFTESSLAEWQGDVARFLAYRARDREAEAMASEALAKLGQGREQEWVEIRSVLALCKARRGDAEGALVDASAALGAKQKFLGERADLMPLLARGQALALLHRAPDGIADLERALDLGTRYAGDRAIRADVRFALARALVAGGGDRTRALELALRAASELDGVALPEQAKRVRAWIDAAKLGAAAPSAP